MKRARGPGFPERLKSPVSAGVLRVIAVVVLLCVVGGGGYLYGRSQGPAGLDGPDREGLELYAEALDVVRDDYVDGQAIDTEKQTYGAIEGMLDSLGDEGHTRFLTPEEREENSEGLSGKYVGVGIQIEDRDDRIVVASPIEGSPAAEAGIESGDVIVAVDGERVAGDEVTSVSNRVRGEEGTEVELTVERDGEERTFTLERAEINSPVAYWSLFPDSNVADVRLTSFSNDSADELRDALEEAREAGAERYVLDLRDNPGGRLDQALEIAGMFLEPGDVVYVRENADGEREKVRADGSAEFADVPLVVLVNGGSASSSEILAGALRDNDRAEVVGQTTFGTGTVLSEFVLDDGSSMLLGIAEWLTPNGDFIRDTGIDPSIRVPLGEDDEPLSPTDLRDATPQQLDGDPQLRRAFEVVTSTES